MTREPVESEGLDSFLEQFMLDFEEGKVRPLDDYLGRFFAGDAAAAAREYAALQEHYGPGTVLPGESGPASAGRLGPYRLEREIGRGGQGVVYEAVDERLDRPVAIKILSAVIGSSMNRERFRREAMVASRLDHPHICAVYETGDVSGVAFIAMRRAEGESLDKLIAKARHGDVHPVLSSVDSIVELVEKLCRAVDAAHGAGVVHRDIKPGNVVVSSDGEPLILDFGLAQDLTDKTPTLTRTGDIIGTPQYMSPEQLRGSAKADGRTDVWSLGVVLYELLTLRRPFEAPTRHGIAIMIENEEPAPLSQTSSSARIPQDLGVVCATALRKETARRYHSAAAFADDLRRVLDVQPILARPATRWQRLDRWARRHPGVAILLTVLFVALTGWAIREVIRSRDLQDALDESQRQRGRAADNAREAGESLKKFVQLADIERLDNLYRIMNDAWPLLPDKVPFHEVWLSDAADVMSRRALHAAALSELEAQEARDPVDQWRLGVLERVVAAIDKMGELATRIESNLTYIETLEQRSLIDGADAWRTCLEDIPNIDAYEGIELEPIMGLVPLRRDPASGLWEFFYVGTGDAPVPTEDGKGWVITEETAVVFVLLPGGSFTMGAQKDDPDDDNFDRNAAPDEVPIADVELAPFLMSKYEVTQAQWKRIADSEPSFFKAGLRIGESVMTKTHPVEQVSRSDAEEYLRVHRFELPSEAEWEYACRAGTEEQPYSTGRRISSLKGHANVADEGSKRYFKPGMPYARDFSDGFPAHAPVGSFLPNAFGLHDMHGNVAEWVYDGYPTYESAPRNGDGRRPDREDGGKAAVHRGGDFNHHPVQARCSARTASTPNARFANLGLRPVLRL